MIEIFTLASAVAALPLLYVMQGSVDAYLARHETRQRLLRAGRLVDTIEREMATEASASEFSRKVFG